MDCYFSRTPGSEDLSIRDDFIWSLFHSILRQDHWRGLIMAHNLHVESDGNLIPHPFALSSWVTDPLQSLSWRCDMLFNWPCGSVLGDSGTNSNFLESLQY